MDKELIKTAVKEALFEAGLGRDTVTISQASKMLSRRHIENGIKLGVLHVTSANRKNSKRLIPIGDVIEYKRMLLERGTIKNK